MHGSVIHYIAMLESGHLSHPGLRRDLNEDTYYGDGKLNLWLVADGIGGHDCGEIASALAREVIMREVRAGKTLTEAIHLADEEIIHASKHRNDTLPMGTTVVAVRVHGTHFEVAWVGDSRAYLWHDGRLIQLNQAHNSIPPPQGRLSNEQVHSRSNVITQALGITDPAHLNVGTITGELTPGMELLLCSDGLTEEVTERDIAATLKHNDCSAQECVDTLVAAALDNGGSDNITVVLIRYQ